MKEKKRNPKPSLQNHLQSVVQAAAAAAGRVALGAVEAEVNRADTAQVRCIWQPRVRRD